MIIVVGINTIREICARNPHGMPETLLSELCEYKNKQVKGIVMAARSIIQLYREVMPLKLPKRERGRPEQEIDENGNKVTIVPKEPVFGEQHVDTGVAGAEGIDTERQITDEEFRKLIEGKELDIDANKSMNGLDVDESDLISKVRKATKDEKIATAMEGKPDHHRKNSFKDEKTAGFSNKDKLKFKDFRL